MKVLLINPPYRRRLGNIWRYVSSALPPLGLGYIAAVLEREGIDVDMIDAQAEGIDLRRLPRRLGAARYDLVGITSTSAMFPSAVETARFIKDYYPWTTIVMGGAHVTARPMDVYDEPAVDYVVAGEGERSFLELVGGAAPSDTPGVMSRNGGGWSSPAGERPLIDNLDSLPFPAFHKLPMGLYHPSVGGYHRLPAVHTLTSRGCPNSCAYCYHIFGRGVRFRSPQNVLEEIEFLARHYGIREVYFYDDTFNARRDRVMEICEGLLRLNLSVEWACLARVEGMDRELLDMMKRAGCHAVTYGVESADPAVLKNINKNLSLETVERVARETVESGIVCRCGFMLGNPGETRESMEKTIRFAIDVGTHGAMFNIVTPYPGTAMFDWGVRNGFITNFNWEQYDFMTPILDVPGLSPDDITRASRRGHRRFFLRPRFFWTVLSHIKTFTGLKAAVVGGLSVVGVLEAAAKFNNFLRGVRE